MSLNSIDKIKTYPKRSFTKEEEQVGKFAEVADRTNKNS